MRDEPTFCLYRFLYLLLAKIALFQRMEPQKNCVDERFSFYRSSPVTLLSLDQPLEVRGVYPMNLYLQFQFTGNCHLCSQLDMQAKAHLQMVYLFKIMIPNSNVAWTGGIQTSPTCIHQGLKVSRTAFSTCWTRRVRARRGDVFLDGPLYWYTTIWHDIYIMSL
jgi:hypothetical protein